MEVSGQLHIPAASLLEKGTHLLGDWVDPKACLEIWGGESAHARNQTLDHPAHSLVTTPTVLSWLL
jgi:hypothetical protein